MRDILITRKQNNSLSFIKKQSCSNISIKDILRNTATCISIEVCPNKHLDSNILCEIGYSFYSVTWFKPTNEQLKNPGEIPAIVLAKQLQYYGYNVLLHLTGRNLNKYQVLKILEIIKNAGIRNIFALQGDRSHIKEEDDNRCDFPYASDLVQFIRCYYGYFFCIGVAGYPEKHPKSENMETDMEFLKHKVSCGADFILTQASCHYTNYSNFVKRCRSIGICIPIIPGLFVISSYRTLQAMSNFCQVPIPKNIMEIVKNNQRNDNAVRKFGMIQAGELIKKILIDRELFGGFHVFSLNNLNLLKRVLINVGIYMKLERPIKSNEH